jgi:lipid II:glycine glycyltransferase (peptidoglycan interpeptide bridge formation enzyme)
MLILQRKKYFLKIAEVYFCTECDIIIPDVDVIIFIQSLKRRKNSKIFKTIHINLEKDEDVLFSNFSKNTRYEINRASKKDNLYFFETSNPSFEDINNFRLFYDNFAMSKNLPRCNIEKLKLLASLNSLHISYIKDAEGKTLCYHVYIKDENRARLLYSASDYLNAKESSFRYLIGRANRYLHWMDIISFKKKGLLIYDLGGLAVNENNSYLKGINDFKRSFGGEEVCEFNSFEPKTILGNFALFYLKIKEKFS